MGKMFANVSWSMAIHQLLPPTNSLLCKDAHFRARLQQQQCKCSAGSAPPRSICKCVIGYAHSEIALRISNLELHCYSGNVFEVLTGMSDCVVCLTFVGRVQRVSFSSSCGCCGAQWLSSLHVRLRATRFLNHTDKQTRIPLTS